MKLCRCCGKNKFLDSFYFRKSGKRAGRIYEKCKECMKDRGRKYYNNNRDRQLLLAIKRRHKYYKLKRKLIDELKDVPCKDCRKKYPSYVMDFDHIDGNLKLGNVASMITRNLSLENIKNEIEKCDILCANCHRIRTYNRKAAVAKVVTAGL